MLSTNRSKKIINITLYVFLTAALAALLFVIFNLNARDAVRARVLHQAKTIRAFLTGARQSVPILEYHGVDWDYSWGLKSWFVSPAEFEKQMKYLKDNGYHTITVKQLDNFKSVKKPVIICFDDAYADVYTYAYPILKRYGLTATVFIVSDLVGKDRYLTAQQIKEMSNIIDFQSHTVSHKYLAKEGSEAVDFEFRKSKEDIEKLTGSEVTAVSYPYSSFNKDVIAAASKYYKYAFIGWGGRYYGFEDSYKIPRIPIYWDDSINTFAKKLKD